MLNQTLVRPPVAPSTPTPATLERRRVAVRAAAVEAEREIGRRRERQWLVAGVLGVDILALVLAVGAAGALRLNVESVLPVASLGWTERHVLASVLVVPILLMLFWLQGRYDVQNCLIGPREYAQIAHATTYGMVITIGLSYFAGGEPLVSRSWLLLVWAFSLLFVSTGRFLSRHVVRRLRRRGVLRTRVVIVGASSVGVALAEQFRAAEGEGIDVLGFLDEYLPVGQMLLAGLPVIGRPDDIVHRDRLAGVDEYILVPQALPHERLEEITRLMIAREGPMLRMAINSSSLLTHGVMVTQRSSVPLITLQRARIHGLDIFLKRGLDVVAALTALIALSPFVLLAVGRAIICNRRPLIVRHSIHTVGGAGATLRLLDQHVTPWLLVRGAPALLSVLSGQLSLIGPRPAPYTAIEPFRALSLAAVKPGLCGPWRLSGPHASRDDQALQDLSYVRSYSIWEDLRILWVTAGKFLARGGPEMGLVRWQDEPIGPPRH
jgi:lipopolysaccharide/colanic/teichoic acid biosynthesis glycosyltransferase